jgi:hypothetical protein
MDNIYQRLDKKFAECLSEVPVNISSNLDFNKDFELGIDGEEFIKNFLISKGFKFISENNDNKYDLLMSYNKSEIKYEIKTDVFITKEKDSGNLVVEFECRNKPSGISVTEADYYVYYIPNLKEVWNIKMSDLKNLIEENDFKVAVGGDKGSNTKMYLIRRSSYRKYFKVYDV